MVDQKKKGTDEKRLKLDLIHGFGSITSRGYRDSVGLVEEEGYRKIIYPIGKYIAIKQIDRPEMNFLRLSENLERIICMTISPNKKFIAICEKLKEDDDNKKKVPQVSVYNVRAALLKNSYGSEKKTFNYADTQAESFIAMSFSNDSRFLVCLTEGPEFKLVFIDLLANKKDLAGAHLGMPITRISISPKDNHMVAISGPNCFKILRVQESSFVYLHENVKRLTQNQNFTDHCWYDQNKIALGNDHGEVYIIKGSEMVQYISSAFDKQGLGVVAMAQYSKGLVIASDNGYFGIWMKDEENTGRLMNQQNNNNSNSKDVSNSKQHQHKDSSMIGQQNPNTNNNEKEEEEYDLIPLKYWSTERNAGVCAIDISSNDDLMAISFKNNDIATFDLTKVIPQPTETLESMVQNRIYKEKKVKFDFVFQGFHSGPITQMDVCVQRPLVATCSRQDSTIRIWNYENHRCELVRKWVLEDQPDKNPLLSIAFHPSGYYLAAGFVDKLRIFHLLYNEMRMYNYINIKGCAFVKFSNGGQYLAAAFPRPKSQHNEINIFHAYTLQQITVLKGHTNTVTEIIWSPFDNFMLSCAIDGGVYEWPLTGLPVKWNGLREEKQMKTASRLTSMLYNEPIDLILVAGGEGGKGLIQEIKEGDVQQKDDHYRATSLNNYRITHFSYIQSLRKFTGIVAGTNTGCIKVFPHIFTGIPFETIPTHDGEVVQVKISPNGRYVFSAGQDGALFIFSVSEISPEGQVVSAQIDLKENGSPIAAITEGSGQEQQAADSQKSKASYMDDALADIVLMPKQDIEGYIQQLDKNITEFDEYKVRIEERMKEDELIHQQQLDDLKSKKLQEAQSLRRDIEKMQQAKFLMEKESQDLLQNMEGTHLKAVEELENLYERKLAFENEKYLQLEQQMREEKIKYEKIIKDMEKKHESNIYLLKNEFNENFSKAQKVYESTKQTADELRRIYEERLSQLEEEHELEIRGMTHKSMLDEENNSKKISKIQNENKDNEKKYKEAKEEKEQLQKELEEKQQKNRELMKQVQELLNDKESAAKEKRNKDEQLKEKEKQMHELKYKISELQKSKHVLSFRTTEMRQSLEPKEAQIEKLKEELFKLESEFENMLNNEKLKIDQIKKMENQIKMLETNLKKQTEATKSKESVLNKIVMDIHNCVTQRDIKEWNIVMQDLYQVYVKQNEIKQNQHDPKGVDEMSRQIGHLEKNIMTLSKSGQKIIMRRENEIVKKTKENAELIYDLNDIRKRNMDYMQELINTQAKLESQRRENNNLKSENQKAQKIINQKKVGSGGGLGQQRIASVPAFGRSGEINQEGQPKTNAGNNDDSQYIQKSLAEELEQQFLQIDQKSQPQQAQAHGLLGGPKTGKIIKGANFDSKTLGTFEKAKMMDLIFENEQASQKLIQQDVIIKNMKSKIKKHIVDHDCDDKNLEELAHELQQFSDDDNIHFPPIQQSSSGQPQKSNIIQSGNGGVNNQKDNNL